MLSTNGILDGREITSLYRTASTTEAFHKGDYSATAFAFLKYLGRPGLARLFGEVRMIKLFGKTN